MTPTILGPHKKMHRARDLLVPTVLSATALALAYLVFFILLYRYPFITAAVVLTAITLSASSVQDYVDAE